MNRSILIVICDFLLLSLLVFSTVDVNKVVDQSGSSSLQLSVVTNGPAELSKDMTAVMRLALDEEHKSQVKLQGDLARAKDETSRQEALAQERAKQALALAQQAQTLDEQMQASERRALALEQELQTRDRQIQALDEKTRMSEQKAIAMQKELDARQQQVEAFKEELQARQEQALKLERERAALQEQYAAAQTNIAALTEQLAEGSSEGVMSREKLSSMEDQVRHQLEQSVALQKQLVDLTRSNELVAVEKERLAGQLEVAVTEKRMAAGQVARMEDEVKSERSERAKLREGLAENMKTLANRQEEIQKTDQKLLEGVSLTPNAIFSDVISNRIDTQILAVRAGMFGGESIKSRQTQTVLVKDGTNTYALCHVQDTPITFWQPGVDWDGLTGTLSRNGVSVPLRSLCFASVDPRVVFIPVTPEEIRRLGCRAYPICLDPYKFQDAVLIGTRESYYGQCNFQIDVVTPEYVRLDRNLVKGLFGKFNPSRGDLVFSKTGELLGVMANNTYCLMLHNFAAEATFKFGVEGRGQRTGAILSALYAEVANLPSKLQ